MSETTESEYYYRYRDYATCSLDEWDGPKRGDMQVLLDTYVVVKHTPKGVWISFLWTCASDERRFVLHDSRKKFACPTVEEAKASFIARKKAQIRIYESRLWDAKRALDIICPEIAERKMRNWLEGVPELEAAA